MKQPDSPCPCQSGKIYAQCCQPLHLQTAPADNPEALMRSRYSAFVLGDYHYLIETHHADHLHGLTEADLSRPPLPCWLGLDLLDSKQTGDQGQVTFKAWYQLDGQLDAIYEQSDFVRENGRWYYTQGQQFRVTLPGRNDPCVCKSGRKFKQCCLKR